MIGASCGFVRRSKYASVITIIAMVSTFSGHARAGINCDPHALAGGAVAGHIGNTLLGAWNAIAGAGGGIVNGPTPSSVIGPCILGPINGRPGNRPPDNDPPVGSAFGDPHLATHDGLAYEFQGAGDYAYIESDVLVLQARQFRLSVNASVSRLQAYAIRFNDMTIIINDPIDASVIGSEPGLEDLVTVNGNDTPIGLGGWIELDDKGSYVQRIAGYTFISLANTARMLLSHDGNTLQINLDASLRGRVTGLMGNFDGDPSNDLQTANGTRFTIDDATTLYGDFLTGWLRQGEDSLFNSAFDPAVSGSIVPTVVQALSEVEGPVRDAAAQRCLEAGIPHGFMLHACTYDMVFDEDEQWLADAAALSENGFDVTPATALVPPQDATIALDINAIVSASQPTPASGTLANAFEVDRYSLTIPEGTARNLNVNEPCSTTQPFSILVELSGQFAQETSLLCESVFALPSGALSLSVFSNSGDIGDYGFSIVEPVATELGVIALNTRIAGSLTANERLIATLPSTPGERVYIATNQNQNCNQRWSLIDSTGAAIDTSRTCIDMGLVTVSESVPYSLLVQDIATASYDFTVLSVDDNSNEEIDTEQPFELTISTPGQQSSATFTLTAGERIYIDREGGVLSGILVVTDPDSIEIARTNPASEDLQFQADKNGSYTVTLEPLDDFTGTVSITLIRIAEDTSMDVNRGQSFELTLQTPGQRASASFNAVTGETFVITESGSGIVPRLFPPGNEQGIQIFGSLNYSVEAPGIHQIVIGPSDGFTGTVAFELQ